MDKLIGALIKAQNKISNANRTAMNEFFKSQRNRQGSPYATLEDVIQAVKEPLLEQGILYQQVSDREDGGICVETIFYGHGSELKTGKLFVPADKQTPHGYGSALTYARRYSLSLACGIGAADDDGNQAEVTTKKLSKPSAKKPDINKDAKYTMINDKGNLLATANDEEEYLELCRSFLKDPEKDSCKELFRVNENTIKKAHIAAVNDTKKSLQDCLERYEK